MNIHPRYIVDEKEGRQVVLLSLSEWQEVIEELEELDDIRAYDRARSEDQEQVPFDQAVREIDEGQVS